jgi:hypothetical protein
MKFILLFCLLSSVAFAKDSKKLPRYFWADGADGGANVFFDLKKGGALTAKIQSEALNGAKRAASKDTKSVFPPGLEGETAHGKWAKKGNTVTFKIKGASCGYKFEPKLEITADETGGQAFSGKGLRCLNKKKVTEFCPCLLMEKNPNSTYY